MNSEHLESLVATLLSGKLSASDEEIQSAVRLARRIHQVIAEPLPEDEDAKRALEQRRPHEPLMEKIWERGDTPLVPHDPTATKLHMGFPDPVGKSIQMKSFWLGLLQSLIRKSLSDIALAGCILRFFSYDQRHNEWLVKNAQSWLEYYTSTRDSFKKHPPAYRKRVDPNWREGYGCALARMTLGAQAFEALLVCVGVGDAKPKCEAARALLTLRLDREEAWNVFFSAQQWLRNPQVQGQIKAASSGARGGRPKLSGPDRLSPKDDKALKDAADRVPTKSAQKSKKAVATA